MTPEAAADLARDALVWLSARPDVLGRFLAETGAGPDDLRVGLRDPALLGALLDFLLADEALLRAFAADAELDPAAPARARAALPGGDLPHWT
jgi:hypothetical protein